MSDVPTSDREALGLPPDRSFAPDPPPRPPNVEQLRAWHRGELTADEGRVVRELTLSYRAWADADQRVCEEVLAETLTGDDDDEIRLGLSNDGVAAVIELVMESYLAGRKPGDAASHRNIVDEAFSQVFGDVPPRRETRLAFDKAAAEAVELILTDHARLVRAGVILVGQTADTEVIGAQHSTLALSRTQPERVVAQSQALKDLTQVAPREGLVYRLRVFAGRTLDEVAELLQDSVDNVTDDFEMAVVEVQMVETDDQSD